MITFTIGDAEMLQLLIEFAKESVTEKVRRDGAESERSIEINEAIGWCEHFLAESVLDAEPNFGDVD